MAEDRRRTVSRQELAQDEGFSDISPSLGQLDEERFDERLADDPDSALELLARMTQATDAELARLAKRLAGRLVLDLTRTGKARSRGVGKLVRAPATVDTGDLDVDASLDGVMAARADGRSVSIDDLVATAWRKPATAICLLVDRSGSMNGERLASAALAAAICSWRAPTDFAVLAFGDRVIALKELDQPKAPEQVVTEVLGLRGHGTTDVALALQAASGQLARSRAARKLTVLLSDAEVTVGGDPVPPARALEELTILAPADDPEQARRLAEQAGARMAEVGGPFSVLDALRRLVQ